ncbi:AAA family ATPase, partial [Ectothiorhodospira sp. 9905]|nr:AAA family ATPase [Ectothiorhodospira sp. 9905]
MIYRFDDKSIYIFAIGGHYDRPVAPYSQTASNAGMIRPEPPMPQKRNLPIGIQAFEKIRRGDHYYVDKTPHLLRLVGEGGYFFLSRPRRFGKSLLLDTLRCLFEGREDLFRGLYV